MTMKKWLTDNLALKILALVLAIALWFYVVGEERSEMGIFVPLELVNIPPDLAVTNNFPHALDLRVSGPRSLLRTLSTLNLSKALDLSKGRPGVISFQITPEGIALPRDLKVTRIHPSEVRLMLERVILKEVEILPRTQGEPTPGYHLVQVTIQNPKVELSGPESVMKKIFRIYTRPIDISGLSQNTKVKVVLDLKNLQVTMTRKAPLEAEIRIKPERR
jgi:YbbR domain-containing protein